MRDYGLPFENRKEAARQLLTHLQDLKGQNPLVLGVPRGAIPMAKIIADDLGGDLDMILVKKVAHPLHPEFALGSVTEDGEIVLGLGAKQHGISLADIEESAMKQVERLKKKRQTLAHGKPSLDVRGRVVVIVDDGIATGATMSASVQSLKAKGAKRIIVVAPVASAQAVQLLQINGVEVRTVAVPEYFGAVGYYYRNFTQVSDAEVGAYFRLRPGEVKIESEGLTLKAIVGIPEYPIGVVVFAHGSGSGRLSPRNQYVAQTLNQNRIATVLADLLTEDESQDRERVFDIDLLAGRLIEITKWTRRQKRLEDLKIGFFGASTGAGAALQAAAKLNNRIRAIVSRGGRPDLADGYLPSVHAPTLLIVGGEDAQVLPLNYKAFRQLAGEKKIEIVEGATHLFEEPGALEMVSELAVSWFRKYFEDVSHAHKDNHT